MDASHTQRVISAILSQVSSEWQVHLVGKEDLTLEKWFVLKWWNLFQDFLVFPWKWRLAI
jgi:hypothetical protein